MEQPSNDLVDFTALLARFGIEYHQEDRHERIHGEWPVMHHIVVTIQNGIGYRGFMGCFFFTTEGKYITYGLWE